MKSLIKKYINQLKHSKTYQIIEALDVDSKNEYIVLVIENASIDDLIKKVPSCYKKTYNITRHLKRSDDKSSVLEQILLNSNEIVLQSFLAKFDNCPEVIQKIINDEHHLTTLLSNRKYIERFNPSNLINMTQLLLDYGLDLSWYQQNQTKLYQSNIIYHNYLNHVIYLTDKPIKTYDNSVNGEYFQLLQFLVNKGLKPHDESGSEMYTALDRGNMKVIDYLLSKNLTTIKGLKNALHTYNVMHVINRGNNPEKVKLAHYLEAYIEKYQIENTLNKDNNSVSTKKERLKI